MTVLPGLQRRSCRQSKSSAQLHQPIHQEAQKNDHHHTGKDLIKKIIILGTDQIISQPTAGSEALLMMFTVKDEIGGLAKAINIISAYDYNMRVMRSRPLKDLPWHYYFYAEMVGSCSDESCERIIRALGASCPVVKIAGRFAEDRAVLKA